MKPKQFLSALGLKSTRISEATISLIMHNDPLTVPELLNSLTQMAIKTNKTTIYRLLQKLMEKGVIAEVNLRSGITHYELVSAPNRHHHHLVCQSCRKVEHLDTNEIEVFLGDLQKKLATNTRYSSITHSLEFFGVCRDCANY